MRNVLLTGAALIALTQGTAHAQSASVPPAPAASAAATAQQQPETSAPLQVDDIVVTAQRREERLQNVPISVQAVTGEAIARQSLTNLMALTELTPSVHVSNDGAGGQAFIRGIGSGNNMIFNQSVGTFIDDIYHGSAHGTAAAFLDVERVEILKGPQSIFFGNNAIAGAISITTIKPNTKEFSGNVRALYGEFGQYVSEGAVNVPLSSTFAIRAAGNLDGQEGWQRNKYVGERQPNTKNVAGRVSALWAPNSDFDAVLKVEGSSNKSRTGQAIGNCPPPAPFVASGACAAAIGLGIPRDGLSSKVNTSGPQGISLDTFESALTANYRFNDFTLTSTTGYSWLHSLQHLDADATPVDRLNYNIEERYNQFSQELRLSSPTGNPLEFMAGAYFQAGRTVGDPGTLSYFYLNSTISGTPRLAPLVPYLPIAQSPFFHQKEHVYSVFGSATWHVTDVLRLNGGLRSTWDRKDSQLSAFNGTATATFGSVVPFPDALAATLNPLAASLIGTAVNASAARTYHALMPSGGLQYTFGSNRMFYLSYARGFKAGVPVTSFSTAITTPVSPEYVNAYEAGFKTEWFNRRLLLNVDVFRSDYSNLQVQATIPNAAGALIFGVTNAAASRSQGVEFEGQFVLSDHFRISTQATYLDSKFQNYMNGTLDSFHVFCRGNPAVGTCAATFPGGVGPTQDYSGRPTTYAPKWSGSVTGAYNATVFGDYRFTGSLTGILSSKFFIGNRPPDDLLVQDKYVRLDGRMSLELPGGRWSIDLVAKNLSNATLYGGGNQGTGLPTSTGSLLVQREQPRNIAGQVRFAF